MRYRYNIEFTFDADARCAITIYYFTTESIEGQHAVYTPRDPSMNSETYHYKAGANQQFVQASHVLEPARCVRVRSTYCAGLINMLYKYFMCGRLRVYQQFVPLNFALNERKIVAKMVGNNVCTPHRLIGLVFCYPFRFSDEDWHLVGGEKDLIPIVIQCVVEDDEDHLGHSHMTFACIEKTRYG